MAWTERQRAMLEAMGVRVWAPDSGDEPVAGLDAAPAPARPIEPEPAPVAAQAARPSAQQAASRASPTSPQAPAIAPARTARETDIAAMDWPALREAVSTCQACDLCQSRRQTVFGVGNTQAHWMIVGEAPGEQEDAQGEPFVGQAGRLLDSLLRSIGQSRAEGPAPQQVFIANTLKCRPPRNRNPQPDELALCRPFLLRQVALVKPKIIIAMGKFAVQSLLGSDEAIGRLRGRVHQFAGVPLVVTYHPAYLLRQLTEKAKSWEDLCLAADVVERGG